MRRAGIRLRSALGRPFSTSLKRFSSRSVRRSIVVWLGGEGLRTRSGVLAVAVVLLWPLVARADAGLPRFAAPDWSSLSTPQCAAVILSLSVTLGWLGIWAFKRPFAAMGILLWLVALAFLLAGIFTILVALGFRSYLALPFVGIPLVVALLSGLAGYKVMKANGEFSNRAILPGLAGLFALALIGALTLSALRWPDSSSPGPPDGIRPPGQPAARRPNGPVPRRVNVPARPPANNPPVETSPSAAPDPTGTAR
jgi:hypothetical protein